MKFELGLGSDTTAASQLFYKKKRQTQIVLWNFPHLKLKKQIDFIFQLGFWIINDLANS
jgi:hypothetical protein